MTSSRRFVICFQQTRTDKNTQSFHILHLCAVIVNASIVFSLGGWQRFGRKTNRWSSPPHQRSDASNMEMTHIQMQLSKPQNRWDLRAEANFPSKLKPSVLRWRLGYDRPTALGVHGWLVMEPTEMCVDRRDARNRRPDWEVTFLSYSWLWSVRADVFVFVFACGVQILVPPQELHAATMQEASDISMLRRRVTKTWATPCKRSPHGCPHQKISHEQTAEMEVSK